MIYVLQDALLLSVYLIFLAFIVFTVCLSVCEDFLVDIAALCCIHTTVQPVQLSESYLFSECSGGLQSVSGYLNWNYSCRVAGASVDIAFLLKG